MHAEMETGIQRLHDLVHAELQARGLDRRTCFTGIYAKPPNAGTIIVECSDDAVARALRVSTERYAPGLAARIDVVALPNGKRVPGPRMVAASVADVRRDPTHAAEMVSQAICGDLVTPLKDDGDWCLARLDDAYIGWIRSWHLSEISPSAIDSFKVRARHRIRDNVVPIVDAPSADGLPVGDAVVGTEVIVTPCNKRGWRSLELPDGREGFVRSTSIEPVPRRRHVSREGLASTGTRFLGIPYLWGGTTPKGFDCSGLIQRIFRLHGIQLPRDSDMQSTHGRSKRIRHPADLRTGDLLFFGKSDAQISHVAMYLSNSLFLHAYGHVRVGSLNSTHPLYDGNLVADWRVTRDPLGVDRPPSE